MFETIEDIDITFEQDGIEVVKQLDKEVLSKGAWTTIIFKYQDWNRQENTYNPPKFTIRRYKKSGGSYREQNKFNISSVAQAEKIVNTLQHWITAET